jgi:DNA polymerase
MRLRGVWHQYHGIKLMPTLHPAYLLRNPGDKKLVWEDIKKVIQELKAPAA